MNRPIRAAVVLAIGVALIALGAGGGWWWASRQQEGALPTPLTTAPTRAEESNVLYWYDPMFPQQHFDQPGQSPFMDMALVPKYAGGSDDTTAVQIDPRISQNLGLRLAAVKQVKLNTAVEATGVVAFDERDVVIEQVRVGGFVERVWPLAPGDVIRAGQALVELRVPEWAAAQQEWLAVRASGHLDLQAAARERLQQLGLSAEQIRELERTGKARSRFVLKASRSGVIQMLDARAGMTLMPGQTVVRINGISTVWLDVAVAQSQTEALRVADPVEAKLPAFADKVFEGRISAILPALNESSRSLRVRVELPNADGLLRPGMSAQVKLHAANNDTALAVPTEALIRTGKRTLVIVADDERHFAPVEVTLGREIGDSTVIAAGLLADQKIVASGQFLIDSEASLGGVLARTSTAPPGSTTPEVMNRPQAELHEADGVVQAITANDITLAHGPFTTLGMPGMTMTFALAKPDLVTTLHVGDKVHVGVRETDDGLIVEQIKLTESINQNKSAKPINNPGEQP